MGESVLRMEDVRSLSSLACLCSCRAKATLLASRKLAEGLNALDAVSVGSSRDGKEWIEAFLCVAASGSVIVRSCPTTSSASSSTVTSKRPSDSGDSASERGVPQSWNALTWRESQCRTNLSMIGTAQMKDQSRSTHQWHVGAQVARRDRCEERTAKVQNER